MKIHEDQQTINGNPGKYNTFQTNPKKKKNGQ